MKLLRIYTVMILLSCGAVCAQTETRTTIHGTVTSESQPLAGAVVRTLELNLVTLSDKNGAYEFKNIPPGNYTVFVRMIGYETGKKEIQVAGKSVRVDFSLAVNPIKGEEVVVSATPYAKAADDLFQSAESRTGDEMLSNPGSSFAERLSDIPGVDVRWNGSSAARPIIRGLSDERVLMLENGLRTGDLSTFDPAHAVPIEPNSIDQVDVIRGPSSIIYGPNTLGGLVNVMTDLVPASVQDGFTGRGLLGGNSVSSEYFGAARVNYGTGDNEFSLGFSGNHGLNLRVPTTTYTDPISGKLDTTDEAPATYHKTANLNAGYLYDNHDEWFGVGFKDFATTYGIPGPLPYVSKLEIDKTLGELHTGIRLNNSFAKELRLSANYSDFSQDELPADSTGNETQGNMFDKKTFNAMLQLLHKPVSGFEGMIGLW
ncbi:MAG TPA: TonB-dependent receptor plug domain-containing protein, partial [Bacteroidota bacterium]|nr:TonB-dependent receptor plug domain-containing protein [Bacteroidota bacterium]